MGTVGEYIFFEHGTFSLRTNAKTGIDSTLTGSYVGHSPISGEPQTNPHDRKAFIWVWPNTKAEWRTNETANKFTPFRAVVTHHIKANYNSRRRYIVIQ